MKHSAKFLQAFLILGLISLFGCGGGGSGASSGGGAPSGGTIKGKVTSGAGIAFKSNSSPHQAAGVGGAVEIPGALCVLEETDKSATSDQGGAFEITGVPAGNYFLTCKKSGANGKVYAFLKSVALQENQTVDLGALEIIQTGAIQGKATLAGQTDSTGILVFIPGTSYQARTDAAGAYLMSEVPDGTYNLRYEKSGYKTATVSAVKVTGGETASVGDQVLAVSTGPTGGLSIQTGSFQNGKRYSNSKTVTVSITASPEALRMQLSDDPNFVGAAWEPISLTKTKSWSFSSEGTKRLYVKFSDAENLESAPVSAEIVIDTFNPSAPVIADTDQTIHQDAFQMALSTPSADPNFRTYQLKGGQYGDWTDTTETVTFNFTFPHKGGYLLSIRGKDWAGNVSSAASITLTLNDPILSDISVTALGSKATIQWKTDRSSLGSIAYGPNSGYGSTGAESTSGTDHRIELTGLAESTTYHYRISSDASGDVTTSTDLTFRTGKGVSGEISTSMIWEEAKGPYRLTKDVVVSRGVTLTIEPGARIEYAGAYSIVVKGGVLIANGTRSQPITFTTVAGLPGSGAAQLTFLESPFADSQLSYIIMEKAEASVLIASDSLEAPPHCIATSVGNDSGVLKISNATLTAPLVTRPCWGDRSAKVLEISNALLSDTSIEGQSGEISIVNSVLLNMTVTAHSGDEGAILIQGSNITNSNLYIGNPALIRLEGTTVDTSAFHQTIDAMPGAGSLLAIALGSVLTESNIDMPVGTTNISDTTLTYSKSLPAGIITAGNGKITHVSITGEGSSTCIEGGLSSDPASLLEISFVYFDQCGIAVKVNGTGSGVKVNQSDFFSIAQFAVENGSSNAVDATNNYWGPTVTNTTNPLVHNLGDGTVFYDPILNAPRTGTGP